MADFDELIADAEKAAEQKRRWSVGEVLLTVGVVIVAILLLPIALTLKLLELVGDFLRRRFT